jgi:hypothetical protein
MNTQVERWGIFELELEGPSGGNPFREVEVCARFEHREQSVVQPGFYDGDGVYRVRFMPELDGDWQYVTQSNARELNGSRGSVRCVPPRRGNHGPVRVADTHHFAYADGTRHSSVGTTCYGWMHQPEPLAAQTLETLSSSGFNKLRMMLFPKNFLYNRNEPVHHAFVDGAPNQSTMELLNVDYFRNVDRRIRELRDLGIEADLIFFTAYDEGRWGYDTMPADVEDCIVKHVVARTAAYRNVWWSLANEWDLLAKKTAEDWERHIRTVTDSDPYHHLCSIHNAGKFFDHHHGALTHVSVQGSNTGDAARLRREYGKPVVYDECQYEGDAGHVWGDLTAQELVHRFWVGSCCGGYVGHSETYLAEDDVLWWGKGGKLKGESAPRIAFLRTVLEEAPCHLDPLDVGWDSYVTAGRAPDYYLYYLGPRQPRTRHLDLPDGHAYRVDVLDTWEMTVTPVPDLLRGKCTVPMPAKPWQALRAVRVG